ncbi:hypothetical protein WJX72_001172 [[Myrmecia] bisecta]|uniref:HNH nuclease domain-containing protein n=1 Tax=[Myrmecia] bisecta TaxID=41462 RepID=A0AAW1Q507_9CHLO
MIRIARPSQLSSLRSQVTKAFTKASSSVATDTKTVAGTTNSILAAVNRCRTLVLDSSYRPIDVVNWQRAICLDLFDKVDVLEYYDMYVRSSKDQHYIPAVLRVRFYVQRDYKTGKLSLTRRNIMIRDKFCCQYCGAKAALTIDHVTPVSKGGSWSWDNLVTACTKCNGKKGDKTLKQLNWKLTTKPHEPSAQELGVWFGSDPYGARYPKEWDGYLIQGTGLAVVEEAHDEIPDCSFV